MIFREAKKEDIPGIQTVRHSVRENILSDPSFVTNQDCEVFLFQRGKGWVCTVEYEIVGFAVIDLWENNVWALFVRPEFEKQGIGRHLHDLMLNWYFEQTQQKLWLGTMPGTRAEAFYKKAGWIETGTHGQSEIKFEMGSDFWMSKNERK